MTSSNHWFSGAVLAWGRTYMLPTHKRIGKQINHHQTRTCPMYQANSVFRDFGGASGKTWSISSHGNTFFLTNQLQLFTSCSVSRRPGMNGNGIAQQALIFKGCRWIYFSNLNLRQQIRRVVVLKNGSWNDTFCWEIKQCKCMVMVLVILRGFPIIVRGLGWQNNDPCLFFPR